MHVKAGLTFQCMQDAGGRDLYLSLTADIGNVRDVPITRGSSKDSKMRRRYYDEDQDPSNSECSCMHFVKDCLTCFRGMHSAPEPYPRYLTLALCTCSFAAKTWTST
jgi:hypothetical protein